MRNYLLIVLVSGLLFACSNNGPANESKIPAATATYDSIKGAGKFTHIDIAQKLDPNLADGGKAVYELKCAACHKLTKEKLVGPGWSGVTERRRPEWIMNFVTNTEEMLNKDPKAQAMLEICMVKMPNQNLSDDEARKILEFMRRNDGVKP